ncbi:MAG: NAD(P)H-binding protein [bacterium]|nr:NAD(P)H-binding protein [bacterium]
MNKKVLIAGASGMIGQLILDQCLSSLEVTKVISLVRRSSSIVHSKLEEIVIEDFKDYSSSIKAFEGISTAFFCIGAYSGKVSKAQFKEITIDFALHFAEALRKESPQATLCLLSGAGADRTEKSRVAFAKFKGIAENKISQLGLEFYAFRPGYIYPVHPRKEPSVMYSFLRWIYPLLNRISPSSSITSIKLAKAMVNVGFRGARAEVLENDRILEYTY